MGGLSFLATHFQAAQKSENWPLNLLPRLPLGLTRCFPQQTRRKFCCDAPVRQKSFRNWDCRPLLCAPESDWRIEIPEEGPRRLVVVLRTFEELAPRPATPFLSGTHADETNDSEGRVCPWRSMRDVQRSCRVITFYNVIHSQGYKLVDQNGSNGCEWTSGIPTTPPQRSTPGGCRPPPVQGHARAFI